MGRYAKGYKPSPIHVVGTMAAAHALAALTRIVPAGKTPDDFVGNVLDQLPTPTCVAHASGKGVQTLLSIYGVVDPPLPSRGGIFWNAQGAAGGGHNGNDGTFIHSAFEAMMAVGFCEEKWWPFVDDPRWRKDPRFAGLDEFSFYKAILETQPDFQAYRMMADQRWVKGWTRITSVGDQRVEEVHAFLDAGYPVVMGTQVDDRFENAGPDDVWPGITGASEGGHAVLATRSNPGGADVLSSWGPNFGANGRRHISDAAIASPNATDFVVPQVAPNFSEAA